MTNKNHTLTLLQLSLLATWPLARPVYAQTSGAQITALSPNSGVTSPGSTVEIYGSGFSPEAVVYFGGLEARETKIVTSSTLQVVTPYLRPGNYQIQLKSGGAVLESQATFTALPTAVDSEIDRAAALAGQAQPNDAIALLTPIATSDPDYQIRAFAHYQTAQIYFNQGDWWRWAGEAYAIFDDADKSGRAVQTNWRYRLAADQAVYLLDRNPNRKPEADLRLADFLVAFDVTQHPEPRFFRALLNARHGQLTKAMADCIFILKAEPSNPSYHALKAYVAVLGGDKTGLQSMYSETITDARALSLLGEAAYLSGDVARAQQWWTQAGLAYPLGGSLACLAGRKHLARGHQRVAEALLNECTVMAPNSREATEARDLLSRMAHP